MAWFECKECGQWLQVSDGFARRGFDRICHSCGGAVRERDEAARARYCYERGRKPIASIEVLPPARMRR